LFGAPEFIPQQNLTDVLACEDDGVCGLAAEQTLLDRLQVARGDLVTLGNAVFRVMAVLAKEPDRVSTGFELGPRLLISSKGLAATGLVTTESMVNFTYRIALNNVGNNQVQARAAIAGFKDRVEERFPEAGWNIRDRT